MLAGLEGQAYGRPGTDDRGRPRTPTTRRVSLLGAFGPIPEARPSTRTPTKTGTGCRARSLRTVSDGDRGFDRQARAGRRTAAATTLQISRQLRCAFSQCTRSYARFPASCDYLVGLRGARALEALIDRAVKRMRRVPSRLVQRGL